MKILISDKTENDVIQKLKNAGYEVTFNEMDSNTLLKEIPNYDALMVRSRTKVVKEVVEAGAKGKLKVIGRAGIGVDNIDIQTAAKNKIKVVNAPTGATASVAELTLLHMLALARQLPKADITTKKGEWMKKQLKGKELFGKTLGLVGTGNIGKLLAKYVKVFSMSVIGYDPFISEEAMHKDGIKKIDELSKLMEMADFISLHIPHTSETHYIINEKMLAKMKPTAYLINCARGGVVDEKALYNAIKNGKIAGAGMDVFEQEPPLKDNPLLTLDNVVVTPHIGANTKEGQLRAGLITAEQMMKVLDGKDPDYWVNKKFFT